jgi:hypothetical protein
VMSQGDRELPYGLNRQRIFFHLDLMRPGR